MKYSNHGYSVLLLGVSVSSWVFVLMIITTQFLMKHTPISRSLLLVTILGVLLSIWNLLFQLKRERLFKKAMILLFKTYLHEWITSGSISKEQWQLLSDELNSIME